MKIGSFMSEKHIHIKINDKQIVRKIFVKIKNFQDKKIKITLVGYNAFLYQKYVVRLQAEKLITLNGCHS